MLLIVRWVLTSQLACIQDLLIYVILSCIVMGGLSKPLNFIFLRVTLLLKLFLVFSLNSECAEVWVIFVWVWRAQDWDPVLLSRGIA